jgi:2-oxoglutarate ferredoxin oxidoreductase subunit gamma
VNRTAVRLAGSGGQGVVLGSVLLGEAALRQGKWAACFHAFGPEARGGAARADVVIADGPLDYPVPREVDMLVALTQDAADRHTTAVRAGGLVLVDSGRVARLPSGPYRTVAVPLFRTAREAVGTEAVGNVAALGLLCALTGLVAEDALREAVGQRFRGNAGAQNLKALEVGVRLGLRLREEAAG